MSSRVGPKAKVTLTVVMRSVESNYVFFTTVFVKWRAIHTRFVISLIPHLRAAKSRFGSTLEHAQCNLRAQLETRLTSLNQTLMPTSTDPHTPPHCSQVFHSQCKMMLRSF
ncbi:hypothetical protein PILCRDRAFT_457130 [Piloderma croceum F 1598]|uniref:Uncharacterized protein n=1 Tax=Piloderma croceum (strain F 1598) TaxID=765440 RepID=A0A0C3FW77_PILCF|nr:hypothetical protein PILCRDRAFT_457130 [Piloderma croceum F 1598]